MGHGDSPLCDNWATKQLMEAEPGLCPEAPRISGSELQTGAKSSCWQGTQAELAWA